jgi:hypothetical protein
LKTIVIAFFSVVSFIACKQSSDQVSAGISSANNNTQAAQNSEHGEMTFKLIPTAGLHSAYTIKYHSTANTESTDPPEEAFKRGVREETLEVSAKLETQVVSSQIGKDWKLSFLITTLGVKIGGKSIEITERSSADAEVSFSATMSKDGELLNIPENETAGSRQRDVLGYRNPLVLLPFMLLPRKPVRIGETWHNVFSSPIPDDMHSLMPTLELKGTGTLKSRNGNRAYVDLTFTSELRMASSNSMPNMWVVKGTASAIYDLDESRFIMNKIDMTRETVGFAFSDNEKDIKTLLIESLQVDLIKE